MEFHEIYLIEKYTELPSKKGELPVAKAWQIIATAGTMSMATMAIKEMLKITTSSAPWRISKAFHIGENPDY